MKHPFYLLMLLVSTNLLICSFATYAQVDVQWDKTYGGNATEFFQDIVTTPDGGYLLAGFSDSPASGDKVQNSRGGHDYWVVKIDESGDKLWDRTFGGRNQENLYTAIATPDGGYLLGGASPSTASADKSEDKIGGYDYWVVKINENGRKQWDRTLGGEGSEGVTGITSTPDGGYLLAGSSSSNASGDKSEDSKGGNDYWVVKIDASGNKLWDKTYGGDEGDQLWAITASPDGGYLLAGHSISNASADKSQDRYAQNHDYWIVKIDESGNKLWDKTLGGSGSESLRDIIATDDGGYLVAGSSSSNAGYDKSENSKGQDDYWVVKIDESGNKLWDKTLGANGGETLSSVIATADEGYLLTGRSTSNASADKSENRKGDRGFDYWIVKVDEQGNKLWDKTLGANDNDYPGGAALTSEGGYLVVGSSNSEASGDKSEDSKGSYDFWAVKVIETAEEDFSVRNLSLVNADTDQALFSLQDGAVINLSDLGNPRLTVRANTTPINVEKVSFELSGPISHTQTEHHWPYALFGDDPKAGAGRDYIGREWSPGEYTLTVTPYQAGRAGTAVSIAFEIIDDVSSAVAFFVLVNADTDQDIRRLREGDIIDLSALDNPQLSIRANTTPINIGRIELSLVGPLSHTQTEHHWPYALFGDDPDGPRDYIGREWQAGEYTLTATPYLNGQKGTTSTISFSVTDNSNSNARLAVEVYPVPTTGAITVSHESTAKEAQMILLDFSGQPLLTQPLKGQTQLDLSVYRKGIYYLKVVDQQGVHLKRVVVE